VRPKFSMRAALEDPNLLGTALPGDSWASWRTLLIAMRGEPLTEEERALFARLTGREREPSEQVREFFGSIGRRGGKTTATAATGVYLSALCDYSDVLAPGETGVLLCVSLDQEVAKIILDRAEAMLEASPILRPLIVRRSSDAIELRNRIVLRVRPASFRKLRGPTYVGVIADEAAYWYTESGYANPDVEILNAVRPALLTSKGPMIVVSSPYARRGVLWDAFRRHFGPGGNPRILVARGTTRDLNPTIAQAEIDELLEQDRARNTAELLAEFRGDIESFISTETVEACVGDYRERLPVAGVTYRGFVDPSGGSEDSFTLAVSHRQLGSDLVVIDAIREVRPRFSPEAVVAEFAALCKQYRLLRITGDRYGGEFPRELFRKHGIAYDLSRQTKSELFRDLLPLLNSGRVVLPRSDRLVSQLVSLERRVGAAGQETISHPDRGRGHDDLANAVAGAAALSRAGGYAWDHRWATGDLAGGIDEIAKTGRRSLGIPIVNTG
jgi:hypothetical protein